MAKGRQLEAFIAQHREKTKRNVNPATFRRFMELTLPPSRPSRRSLPSVKFAPGGGLTPRERAALESGAVEEPVNLEVLDRLMAGWRADVDEFLAQHQAEMSRRRVEQQARAYSDRLTASVQAERAARASGGVLPYGNVGRLPSFATGGTFGFTPQEIEQFGGGAPATPSATLPPASTPVAEIPAIPATTSLPPAPAAAEPRPAPITPAAQASQASPTTAQISAEQAALWGLTRLQPAAAAPQPPPPAPAMPGSEFTPAEVQQFGDSGLATLSQPDIQRAFAQDEAERLAFERDFGPIIEQEQLDATQRQFNDDFAPLVEQEIADMQNRQQAQFERDFARQEAAAEQERLTEERLAREQFESEFGGERGFAQDGPSDDGLNDFVEGVFGYSAYQTSSGEWHVLTPTGRVSEPMTEQEALTAVDPDGVYRAQVASDPQFSEFERDFTQPLILSDDPAGFAPVIEGSPKEQKRQAILAMERKGWDHIAEHADKYIPFSEFTGEGALGEAYVGIPASVEVVTASTLGGVAAGDLLDYSASQLNSVAILEVAHVIESKLPNALRDGVREEAEALIDADLERCTTVGEGDPACIHARAWVSLYENEKRPWITDQDRREHLITYVMSRPGDLPAGAQVAMDAVNDHIGVVNDDPNPQSR